MNKKIEAAFHKVRTLDAALDEKVMKAVETASPGVKASVAAVAAGVAVFDLALTGYDAATALETPDLRSKFVTSVPSECKTVSLGARLPNMPGRNPQATDASALWTEVLVAAEEADRDPKTVASSQGALCGVVVGLDPVIQQKTDALVAAYKDLRRAESQEGLLGKLFTDTDAVASLKEKIATLESDLSYLRSASSGANTLLRIGNQSSALTDARARFGKLHAAVDNTKGKDAENWKIAVRDLVKANEELSVLVKAPSDRAQALSKDAAELQRMTSVFNRHGFPDWLSTEGKLYRTSRDQADNAADAADAFKSFGDQTRQQTHAAVKAILRSESPAYLTMSEKSDKFQAAHASLERVIRDITTALLSLDSAGDFIDRRNRLADQESRIEREKVVTNEDGTKESVFTAEYLQWQTDFNNATFEATRWSDTAESQVGQIKRELVGLRALLLDAGLESTLPDIRSNIDSLSGPLSRLGTESLDGKQVAGINSDVTRLLGRLESQRDVAAKELQNLYGPMQAAFEKRFEEFLAS